MSRAILSRLGAGLRDEAGAAASEFALVVPFFIVLVFGTINTGLAISAVNQIHYAAERSARCLAVDPNASRNCTTDVDAYAKNWYRGPLLSTLSFAANDVACGKQVIGTGSYEIITGLSATSVSISATACYPLI